MFNNNRLGFLECYVIKKLEKNNNTIKTNVHVTQLSGHKNLDGLKPCHRASEKIQKEMSELMSTTSCTPGSSMKENKLELAATNSPSSSFGYKYKYKYKYKYNK